MTTYDPKIMYEFADRLYKRANQIIIVSTIIGVLVGGGGGLALEATVGVWTMLAAVLGGVIGYLVGRERAFSLKLQAQTALCQVKIEENTRQEQ